MKISSTYWRVLWVLAALALIGAGRKPDSHPPISAKGGERARVKNFAKAYGFHEVKVKEDHVRLKGKVHELKLFKDSRKAEVNGSRVWLNDTMSVRNRRWTLSRLDVDKTLAPVVRPTGSLAHFGYKVVVLDPGHGGEDSGAVSAKGLQEKAVALDIALRVRKRLIRAGYTVYTTRHKDDFLELAERPRRAKTWKADAFVSIHANSGPKTARGTETFVLSLPGHRSTNDRSGNTPSSKSSEGNGHDEGNMALGFALHHKLRKAVELEDRGVRRARFQVLREAPCPAALVEVGFLSHAKEAARLANAAHREKIAVAIADGIENYLRDVKRSVVLHEPSSQGDNL